MREIRAGVRSVAEAQARAILSRSGLPQPVWNVTLRKARVVLAVVDAYWEAFGVVLEIDSMEWHLSPADYKKTQRRQRLLARSGLILIPISPSDVIDEPAAFLATVNETLRASTGPIADIEVLATAA